MDKIRVVSLSAVLAVFVCLGQGSALAAAQAALAATGHGAFPVRLTKTLDSSKLKEGETIEVETAGSFKLADGTLVSKGSKLMGHVTAAKSRSKGDPESQLALAFDKLNLANGKQLSIKGTVQAVFPPAEEQSPNMSTAGTSLGGSQGGGGLGAAANAGGVGVTNSKSGSDMQSASTGKSVMDSKSTGVQGIHDLQLDNGVLTSKGKQVKLVNGIRMIVHVDIFG